MSVQDAREQITQAVLQWEGVRGKSIGSRDTQYLIGKREIGHIHGDQVVDIPFPTSIRQELVDAGRARPHRALPDSGWVSFYIREAEDVEQALALLRRSYEIATKQRRRRVPDRSGSDG